MDGLSRAPRPGEEIRMADRSCLMALASVRVMWACPTTSSKRMGRYFRYREMAIGWLAYSSAPEEMRYDRAPTVEDKPPSAHRQPAPAGLPRGT